MMESISEVGPSMRQVVSACRLKDYARGIYKTFNFNMVISKDILTSGIFTVTLVLIMERQAVKCKRI